MFKPQHCDAYIHDLQAPACLRLFLLVERLPAADKVLLYTKFRPTLFATYRGKRVRVTLASCLGDLGISTNLEETTSYDHRVTVEDLTAFSEVP